MTQTPTHRSEFAWRQQGVPCWSKHLL